MLALLFFVSMGTFSILLSKILFRSLIAPVAVYAIAWGSSLSLYMLQILPSPELSERTITLILVSWTSFIAGSVLSVFMPPVAKGGRRHIISQRAWRNLLCITGSLGFSGSLLMLWQVFSLYRSEFFYTPWIVRYALTLSEVTPPTEFLLGARLQIFTFTSAALSGMYIRCFGFKWFTLLALIAGMLWMFAIVGRWQLLYIVFLYAFGYIFGTRLSINLHSKNENKPYHRYMVSLFAAGLGFIIFISYFTTRSGSWLSDVAKLNAPPIVLGLIERLVHPLWHLDYILQQPSPLEGGVNVANPAFKVMAWLTGERVRAYPGFYRGVTLFNPEWGENFVPPTYLAHAYWDFGNLGLCFVPFLLGLVSSVLFVRRSLTSTLILPFIYVAILRSSADWVFWYPDFTMALLLAICIGGIARVLGNKGG